jgi:LmbE family N-acetylglucosaminyl deacetylase
MRQIADDALIAPARHVLLSPHYDDIALSVGGTTAKLSSLGRTPEVALIFGDHPDPAQPMTEFANSLHTAWGLDASQVIASRRAEEAAASRILGATDKFLPFRDAIYRGRRYLNDEQLFDAPVSDETELPAAIIGAAGLSDAQPGEVRVYAPLAAGFHVDHQQAFNAGLQLARRGIEVWFYEDLPYSLQPGGPAKRAAAVAGLVEPTTLVDVSGQWSTKLDAIFAYPSQLTTVFVDYVDVGIERAQVDAALAAYARGVGEGELRERFWTAIS